jgi:hypothetical protein
MEEDSEFDSEDEFASQSEMSDVGGATPTYVYLVTLDESVAIAGQFEIVGATKLVGVAREKL